ncbi:MAG: hypothetical protein ACJ798_18085 [Phenylobacterium sp.]
MVKPKVANFIELDASPMANFADLAKESSMLGWSLTGDGALIKVVSMHFATGATPPASITGYFTQVKFIRGMTSLEIERDLGLQPQSLLGGAVIIYATRLPRFGEFDYRLSAALPNGRIWTPEMHEQFDRERKAYTGMRGDTVRYYPPGKTKILQWEMRPGCSLPISKLRSYATGTIPYTP